MYLILSIMSLTAGTSSSNHNKILEAQHVSTLHLAILHNNLITLDTTVISLCASARLSTRPFLSCCDLQAVIAASQAFKQSPRITANEEFWAWHQTQTDFLQ